MRRRIAAVAARQFGLITRAQLLQLGASSGGIDDRIARGVLRVVHPGVYAIAGAPRSWEQSLMAALLAAGPRSALCGLSAAEVWRLEGLRAKRPQILIPEDRRVRIKGVVVRRTRNLLERDVVSHGKFRVTTVERTLIDLSGVLHVDVLEDVVDEALRRRLTTAAKLAERISRLGRGIPGIARLRRIVHERLGARPRGSKLESRFRRRLARSGVRLPVCQYELRDDAGRFVAFIDFAYPDEKLAIEIDGSGHLARKVREQDLVRQNRIILLGWRILRFTEERTDHDPDVPKEIENALARRPADDFPLSGERTFRTTDGRTNGGAVRGGPTARAQLPRS